MYVRSKHLVKAPMPVCSLLTAVIAMLVLVSAPCAADPAIGQSVDSELAVKGTAAETKAADKTPPAATGDYQKEMLSNPYANSYAQMNAITQATPSVNAAAQDPKSETGKVDKESKLISRAEAKKKIAAIVNEKMAKAKAAASQPTDTTTRVVQNARAEDSLLK